MKYIITPEGRVVKNGSTWDFEYNLTDHLGNTRAVIHKGSNGLAEVIQEWHYYPFGMEMSGLTAGTSSNKYLYNGKELQSDFDLDWYDYGARFYDPALGRWHTPDAYAEFAYSQSPYCYVANNPIKFIDPDGNFKTKFGAWLWKTFNGGGDIQQSQENKEYYVAQRVKDTDGDNEVDVTLKRTFDWGGKGNNNTHSNWGYWQKGGLYATHELGQGNPYRAENTENIGSLNDFLNVVNFDPSCLIPIIVNGIDKNRKIETPEEDKWSDNDYDGFEKTYGKRIDSIFIWKTDKDTVLKIVKHHGYGEGKKPSEYPVLYEGKIKNGKVVK